MCGSSHYAIQVTYTNPPFLEKEAYGKQKTELGGSVF